jgi:hypothetical protein
MSEAALPVGDAVRSTQPSDLPALLGQPETTVTFMNAKRGIGK